MEGILRQAEDADLARRARAECFSIAHRERVVPCVEEELLHSRLASCTPHTPRCNVGHFVENKHDGMLGRHSGTTWCRVQTRLRGLGIIGA
jgi:hypothetical protein